MSKENPIMEVLEDTSLNGCYEKLFQSEPKLLKEGAWDEMIKAIIDRERDDRLIWLEKQDEKGREE